jgi:hypothetical protein
MHPYRVLPTPQNTMTSKNIHDLADIAAIAEMDDDDLITYQYWGDRGRVANFLKAVDADVMATSRISNVDGSQKRPLGSLRQKMPPEVAQCPKACDKVKALSPAHLEAHGGIAQLIDIGWLRNGDPCILYLSEAIVFVGFIRDGCIVPHLEQTLRFKTPSDWIRHMIDEGLDVDKKNFEMATQHLNLKTQCYRFLHFPVFNNATLHQLASMYVHSNKCENTSYPLNHKKQPRKLLMGAPAGTIIVHPLRNRRPAGAPEVEPSRKRDRVEDIEIEEDLSGGGDDDDPPENGRGVRLTRDDIKNMFISDVTLDLDASGIVHRELQQEIMHLHIKLAAFHQFFMAINPN